MKIRVLAFGKIADILSCQEMEMTDMDTAGAVRSALESRFPTLKGMRYQIAVDKKIAPDDRRLEHNSEVALLPPFSGG